MRARTLWVVYDKEGVTFCFFSTKPTQDAEKAKRKAKSCCGEWRLHLSWEGRLLGEACREQATDALPLLKRVGSQPVKIVLGG